MTTVKCDNMYCTLRDRAGACLAGDIEVNSDGECITWYDHQIMPVKDEDQF
jgi:hypothetical protein